MLIDLGVTCAWIAMSTVGGAVLVLLGGFGSTRLAADAEDPPGPQAHEDLYPHESLPALAEMWQ
jgi:hypothetical protein